MKKQQAILKVCLFISLIALLSGCATIPKENIATGTTDYNLAVEKAQNEMLLLNIIRASKRYPMYFTTISDMKGSLSYGVSTGSLSIPFGKIGAGPNTSYSIAPSATYSVNPVFGVALLNSKEFTQGMLSPLSAQTLDFFWQQGWPKEMLLYLFVQRIEMGDKTLLNYPGDETFSKFQSVADRIATDKNCLLKKSDKPDEFIGPQINAHTVATDLKNLIELQKAGLKLKLDKTSGKYRLAVPQKGDYILTCNSPDPEKKSESFIFAVSLSKDDKSAKENKLYLRSPEGVLYYLGELMRAEANQEKILIKNNYCEGELFVARREARGDENPNVAVNYEGIKYVIPRTDSDKKCPKDRSMHVLALMSLLISKQQSVGEIPPPSPVVTTIGR